VAVVVEVVVAALQPRVQTAASLRTAAEAGAAAIRPLLLALPPQPQYLYSAIAAIAQR